VLTSVHAPANSVARLCANRTNGTTRRKWDASWLNWRHHLTSRTLSLAMRPTVHVLSHPARSRKMLCRGLRSHFGACQRACSAAVMQTQ
jgi:hypothetical protein